MLTTRTNMDGHVGSSNPTSSTKRTPVQTLLLINLFSAPSFT